MHAAAGTQHPAPRAGGLFLENPEGTAFQTGILGVASISFQHNIALVLEIPKNSAQAGALFRWHTRGCPSPKVPLVWDAAPEDPALPQRCLPGPETAYFMQDVMRLQQTMCEQPTGSQMNTELEKKGPNAKVIPAEEYMSTCS